MEIRNVNQGKLKATHKLSYQGQKEFSLDSNTAPRPQYLQVYSTNKNNYLTILNTFKNAIYVYDYDSRDFVKSIEFSNKDTESIHKIMCYYFMNTDSIYVFDANKQDFVLTSDKKKIIKSLSLIGNRDPQDNRWALDYPQHNQTTASPILKTRYGLLFPGQHIWSIPDNIIKKFKYTAKINFQNSDVSYIHHYPQDIYASHFGWDDPIFTAVYADINSNGDKIIYSFPISHDLYIADISGGELKKMYGGSNLAGSIKQIPSSVKDASDPKSELKKYVVSTDLYAAIKYDKYRKVYYRFLERRLSEEAKDRDWKKRELAVIIMDENFKYLGETSIGTLNEWNWENSFVTENGLNIEYFSPQNDESQLIFRIFTLKLL